ncbi:MAG: hypothetical protein KAW56_06725, partial [Candidatus Marinimicrobia bacterium]|nr:hypothetical protein [Candidatus Neomarinimicrobiota bacterium]
HIKISEYISKYHCCALLYFILFYKFSTVNINWLLGEGINNEKVTCYNNAIPYSLQLRKKTFGE